MTTPHTPDMPTAAFIAGPDRRAGQLAILGGAFGIAAFACLISFLLTSSSAGDQGLSRLLLRSHAVGVILQSLGLIPLALALDAIARRNLPGSNRSTGVAAVALLALVKLVHIALAIGTLIGCSTYPVWSALAGRWLVLRGKAGVAAA